MTIYVDESIWPHRGQLYCHMYSDSGLDDLHQFAQAIGLRRSWFQDKPHFPHYDLSPKLRAVAVRNGAVSITTTEMVNLKRKTQGLEALRS